MADMVIGEPTNHILAAANRSAKLRYAQSVHENIDNNPTIDKILFAFANNVDHILVYNNEDYSCIVIDNKIAYELRGKISGKNIEECLGDAKVIYDTFEEFWNIHFRDTKIRSIKQTINSLSTSFKKGDFVFRGQVNCEWELIPSLLRNCEMIEAMNEAKCFKPLFYREYIPYLNTIDPIEYFVNCQHYGIKTRLLDFTRDILIALFFACYDPLSQYEDADGRLCVIEYNQFPEFNFNLTGDSAFKDRITKDNLEIFKNRLNVEYPTIFEPLIKNPRMRLQEGVLMLFPILLMMGNIFH